MNPLWKMTLEEIRLDWINNFISVEGFASHYKIPISEARFLILLCRQIDPCNSKELNNVS